MKGMMLYPCNPFWDNEVQNLRSCRRFGVCIRTIQRGRPLSRMQLGLDWVCFGKSRVRYCFFMSSEVGRLAVDPSAWQTP